MHYSLSTMWAQQERFADMHEFVRAARDLGYDAIEVSHVTNQEAFDRLVNSADARLSSIHAPAPKVQVNGRSNSSLNLAATDAEERRLAVEQTKRSIGAAAKQGAGFVVVHLGGVGDEMFDAERSLRRLYDTGTRAGPEIEGLRRECRERRMAGAPEHLEQATQSLRELVEHGRARGVAIGLENRYHYHEIPDMHEAGLLLSDYPPEQAGYWHDVGHAEVLHRLGLGTLTWLQRLGPRTLGSHLHDVDGLADHRAPGNGDVDWSYIAAGLPKTALRVFEINQRQPDEAVGRAIAFLREHGVVT